MEKPMRIAIIGGGKRCRAFLEMLDAKRFPRLRAQIVAVADPDEQAAGIRLACEKGIYTTGDYRDFYRIRDLDLVIELTGNEEHLQDFLRHYPAKVRVLEATISRLFGDIIRFREEYLFREQQLKLIESIIDSIFLSIRDWVLITRPDFKIVDANEAFLRSMALSKEDVIGKSCHEIMHRSLHPCEGDELDCPLRESLSTGAAAYTIHEHLDGSNQVRYSEITTMPLKDKKGDIELIIEIVRDITAELEKKLEQKTRALKRDLARLVHEDKMIALGKLVASAAHEINNPLSGIHALARLMHQEMEGGELSEETRERFKYYLHLIDTESARCSSIVTNLLSFSRQQKVERKKFQLNELIQKVVLLCGHKLKMQQIEMRLNLMNELPLMVGDPGQIQQCLLNLIFNSMESMPEGGTIMVTTCMDPAKPQLRLEVQDTGVGIPENMISQIFEPFFSTKTQDKGVGLGLSVIYGIVKEHGGSIYVKSDVGKGAHFILRFPLEPEG
jgi:PAS domain S-box-containing protein